MDGEGAKPSVAGGQIPEIRAAQALVAILGAVSWEAVGSAKGYIALRDGVSDEDAARIIYRHGGPTLTRSRGVVAQLKTNGFYTSLIVRERTGSAENPITKLFPARVTEQRFMELLDDLCGARTGLTYRDDRDAGGGLSDFTLLEGDTTLPVNVKNAGTRFEKAASLVGLDPDDCVPIPAYKAHHAVESMPNLLYVVAVDYTLLAILSRILPSVFNADEVTVWALLNNYAGGGVRKAEDAFVNSIVKIHWDEIKRAISATAFRAASARKAIRILQTLPKRTPGIGLRAWGTGAAAEVNVHLSIRDDMRSWDEVRTRIVAGGLDDIVRAVNRRRQEMVYDPEI